MTTKDSAELRELLHEFGREYEWPYRFMPDMDRSPADQQSEAREALVNEFLPKLKAHTAAQVAATRVDERELVNSEIDAEIGATMLAGVLTSKEAVDGYKSAMRDVKLDNKDRIIHLTAGQKEETE